METSILSTRKIVPVAGMDTTLLVVVVEVTIGALWMKPYENTLLVHRLLILLLPFLLLN